MRRYLTLLVLLLSTAVSAAADKPPAKVDAAMKDLWRRGTCLLSSVHKPAAREATVPSDVGQTPVLWPRLLGRRGELLCYAVDGATLWTADDQSLHQIDAAGGKLIKTFTRADGLPDSAVESIVPTGGAVHLVTRAGLAVLDRKSGRIAGVPDIRFTVGRLAVYGQEVWLVSEAGCRRLGPGGGRAWRKVPDPPEWAKFAQIVRRGFWIGKRRSRLRTLLPWSAADDGGLYVICLGKLLHFSPSRNQWRQVGPSAWQAMLHRRKLWAMTTTGLLSYDPASGQTRQYRTGEDLAGGRPIALAATGKAVFLATEPDYKDDKRRFVGGGISRLDLETGKVTTTETVGGLDMRFVSTLRADGNRLWASCLVYDGVVQLSAHPGMAHVKRWKPKFKALALLTLDAGKWSVVQLPELPAEKRWVMGQRGKVEPGQIAPGGIESLFPCGDRLWGVLRMFPRRYYSGYFVSAGCLAERAGGKWIGRADLRTRELDLVGEYPEVMLISHSHGVQIVLADGQPTVLGVEPIAGRTWAICESGAFVLDAAGKRFTPIVREADRLYWRATAAVAARDAVWFGGDCGTIGRLDRATGRLSLVGVAGGRKIDAMGFRGGQLVVRSTKTAVSLPPAVASAPALPDADCLTLDIDAKTKTFTPGRVTITAADTGLSFRPKSNYLYQGDRRVAFVAFVYRPKVLCGDPNEDKLWLSTYSGVASIPLPPHGGK